MFHISFVSWLQKCASKKTSIIPHSKNIYLQNYKKQNYLKESVVTYRFKHSAKKQSEKPEAVIFILIFYCLKRIFKTIAIGLIKFWHPYPILHSNVNSNQIIQFPCMCCVPTWASGSAGQLSGQPITCQNLVYTIDCMISSTPLETSF